MINDKVRQALEAIIEDLTNFLHGKVDNSTIVLARDIAREALKPLSTENAEPASSQHLTQEKIDQVMREMKGELTTAYDEHISAYANQWKQKLDQWIDILSSGTWLNEASSQQAVSDVAIWADIPEAFNKWWDADLLTQTNPFTADSPAYWAWEGWRARAAQPLPAQTAQEDDREYRDCDETNHGLLGMERHDKAPTAQPNQLVAQPVAWIVTYPDGRKVPFLYADIADVCRNIGYKVEALGLIDNPSPTNQPASRDDRKDAE
jgi:hypothetical protein